jgi:alkylated DNA repair dioxygenase AlkB
MTPDLLLTPGFLPTPQPLFEHLKRSVHWDERMRARKTASFGVSYDYSQIAYAPAPMPAEIEDICGRLEAVLGFRPNNCLMNYYVDGDSSMGFHSDSAEELAPGTGVAIVSLGSERTIVFRAKANRHIEQAHVLPAGSLLYMTMEMQSAWLHAIPRSPGSGERISLTFRAIVK